MNARTRLISLSVLLATGFGFWVYCQTGTAQVNAPRASIVFCNPNKILQSYKKAIAMRADLINEQDRIRQKVTADQKEIRTKSEELAGSGFAPESPEYQKLRKELFEKSINYEVFAKVSREELRNRNVLIGEVCGKDVYEAVQKIARKKGYLMVFQQVLYGDESLDISNEVIEQLNTDYELGG